MADSCTEANLKKFERLWAGPSGFASWFNVVNNQRLGTRFMLTAFGFFVAGGILALLMRVQLMVPDNDFLGPQVYNQLFTMHGSTMMYLFAVPFLEGLALYLLPLMIGSRDVAFPRLTAFSYWTYLFGGIVFYSSFIAGMIPDAGWFAYTPLSGPEHAGSGVDFWLLGLAMVEIAGLTAGAEIVVTLLKLRAPGMAIHRMPMFAWAMLVVGVMILFAFTVLLIATLLLEMDRAIGTMFFNPDEGGSTLLWQHLFWFFGHPEVYIMFLPATGIVSMLVATFAGRALRAYALVAMAIVVTGFMSFGLWVHHMYATGLPELGLSFFAAASLMVGVASGIQIFAWIGTLWGTRPVFTTSLLYVLGFVFIFVLGGFTGVMIAVVPFNWQVHDTFFIVAHFHYVLIGGVVFPIFAGLHYWLPKITGRMMNEALGKWSFWLTFLGFNLTFFPMHVMGFLGMPRRVYTYQESLQLDGYNVAATIGAFIMALGFLAIAINFFRSYSKGEKAGENPWNAGSLEWSVSSPPPIYSFFRLPIVRGREPLWLKKENGEADETFTRPVAALAGEPLEWRATLNTDPLNARPVAVQYLAGPSNLPILAAIGLLVAFLGILTERHLVFPLGMIFTAAVFIAWLSPSEGRLKKMAESNAPKAAGLPVYVTGRGATAWWGMACLLAICATAFGTLFYSYFYLWLFSDTWPQGDLAPPSPLHALPAYLALLLAGAGAWLSGGAFRKANLFQTKLALGASCLLAVVFAAAKTFLVVQLPFTHETNAYGSIFHVLSWVLLLFAACGIAMLVAALVRLIRHPRDPVNFTQLQLQLTRMFWYFIATAAAATFAVLYLSPHLISR